MGRRSRAFYIEFMAAARIVVAGLIVVGVLWLIGSAFYAYASLFDPILTPLGIEISPP